MTDESLMTFGKYKGIAMANVPSEYLLWIYNQDYCYGDVKQYIKENLDAINFEIKNRKK
jgi:uncharacterized protein (DUF3820 family)